MSKKKRKIVYLVLLPNNYWYLRVKGSYKKLAKEDPMSKSKFCQRVLSTLALKTKWDFFKILTQHNQIS